MVVYSLFVNIKLELKMKKIGIGIIGIAILLCTFAYAEDRYVRKTVRPSFFIPEKEFDKREKLPPFPALESGAIKITDEGVMLKIKEQQKIANRQKPKRKKIDRDIIGEKGFRNLKMVQPEEPAIEVPAPEKKVYSPDDGLGNDLAQDPEYINKLKIYDQDLRTISETGKMPDNLQLKSDLDAMNSNLSFSVQ